jgi:hypothetical protein
MTVLQNRILTAGSVVAIAAAVATVLQSGILANQNAGLVRILASVVWGS